MTPEQLKKYTAALMLRAARNLEDAESNMATASYNVASSQAYYCMLDAATALLATRGFRASEEDSDAEFIKIFAQHFILTGDVEAQLKDYFEQALAARQACYQRRHSESQEEARGFIEKADEFLEAATERLKSELRGLELPDIRQKREAGSRDVELH